ncbi:PREDICTED: uncharacterized protein LOC104602699 [Nelumbo nucifera]|uniref:Uncharacterized protein LOC104602699 n=2 Tax=Nelumbo nucifera TaxID=4432 RepID=A0A1U8AD14_NELNU|nr:PREDICTED: uncharacterized protein LOC104602699 [Nelumbo nucifera]DAD35420.1 TPA_asm: hypothetical protein HUJ06_006060 [Nelumbo nucifera]
MATLQKFKLLATQCAVAGSPTRSPTTSPVVHLRRRKTLRMLLGRSGSGRRLPRREESPDREQAISPDPPENEKKALLSHTLKDLFVSSPPFEDINAKPPPKEKSIRDIGDAFPSAINRVPVSSSARRGGIGSPRPLSAAFRYRLLRRPWRPVLVAIPE